MAHIQSAIKDTTATVHTIVLGTNVTAGNTIVVFTRKSGTGVDFDSIADNQGNTYVPITAATGFNDGARRIWGWYAENVAAGATTVSITMSVSTTLRSIAAEYSNTPSSGVLDDSEVAGFASTTSPVTAVAASSTSGGTLVAFVQATNDPAGIAPASGETERQSAGAFTQLQDKLLGAPGNYSSSWTFGAAQPGSHIAIILKAAASQPTINNVDGDNNITATQAGVVISCANAGSDGANAKIELVDGAIVSQCTKTAWTSTSITFTAVQGNVKYGNVSVRITTHAGLTASQVVTLAAPATYTFTNVAELRALVWNPDSTPSRLTPKASAADGTADCLTAVQFEQHRTTGSGTAAIDTDGRLSWPDTVTQIQWRWHNGTVWSSQITWDLRGLFPRFNGPTLLNKTFTSTVPITSIDFAPQFSDADGGTATYTLQGGAITGLSLSSAGVLTGTPTVPASNTNRQIRRTDNEGSFADSNAFTIVVQAAPNPPFFSGVIPTFIITTGSTIPATSVASFFTFVTAYSISPTVPPGMSFNTGTGEFTGTPILRGLYGPYIVTGTGTGTPATSNSFTIEIVDPPVEFIEANVSGFSNSYNMSKKKKRKSKAKKLTTKDILASVKLTRK